MAMRNELRHTDGCVEKIPTGLEGLDVITKGGLPRGRSTLVAGTSGSAKTILAAQYLVQGIQQYDDGAVLVTFEEAPDDIRRNMRSFGWDLSAFEKKGKLAFVDVSPDPSGQIIETGDYDFSGLLARMQAAIKMVNAKRVSIDSIGTLFSQFADRGLVRRELFRVLRGLKELGVTALVTAERTDEYGDIARFGVEEFVADNVLILRNVLADEKRRRTVEVLKYRGTSHQKGEFPFTITQQGIEVLPLSAMELTQRSSSVRIPSGSAELDTLLGGGFYRDSIILASGPTGTGKTLLATTFLDQGGRCGERTLLFAFEESREQYLRNATAWGKAIAQAEKQGLFRAVCAYPESQVLEDHLLRIKREIEAFKPTRLALDSLSALEHVSTEKSFREFVLGLTCFIKEKEIAGLFTSSTMSLLGGASITERHISNITDTIILLRYVELMGQMRRGLTVLKMRGSYHDKGVREFEIDDEGLHIGEAFHTVNGVLAGMPVQVAATPTETGAEMFAGAGSR